MNSKDSQPKQHPPITRDRTQHAAIDDPKPTDDTLDEPAIPSVGKDASSTPTVSSEHQDTHPSNSEYRHQTSNDKKFEWKFDNFVRNLLVAVTAALLALGAANWYEDKRFERLYDEVTFRYFDAISRVLDGKIVSRDRKKKHVYFSLLDSIGRDVEHIRQNKIFAPGKDKAHELAVLQTLVIQAISLKEYDELYGNNILLVMGLFCDRYEDRVIQNLAAILRKNHSDRTENEHVIVNAQLICDANFK